MSLLVGKCTLNKIIATDKIIAKSIIQAQDKCKAQSPTDKIIAKTRSKAQNYCYERNSLLT